MNDAPAGRVGWGVLAALAVAALVPRALLAADFWGLGQDQCSFLYLAQAFRDGTAFDGWTNRMLHPGFPLGVALVGTVVEDLEWAARGISIAASTVLCVAAASWWGARRGRLEGVALGLFAALHPGTVLFGAEALVEALWMLPLAAGLLACASGRDQELRLSRAALAGAAFGAAALIKPTALAFVPGAVLATVWPWLRRREFAALLRPAAVFVVACLPLAFASQGASLAIRGDATSFVGDEFDYGDKWVDATHEVAASREGVVTRVGRRMGAMAELFFTKLFPRFVQPWFLVLPLALVGTRSILGRAGPARTLFLVATVSLALEWLAMGMFFLTDRVLWPGVVVLLPALAAGAGVCARAASGARAAARAWILAPACLAVLWAYMDVRMIQRNAAVENRWRDMGRAVRALGDARPRRILSSDPQVPWYGRTDRVRFASVTPDDVREAMDAEGCDGLSVTLHEIRLCPGLEEVLDMPLDGTWNGLRVVVAVDGGRVLQTSE